MRPIYRAWDKKYKVMLEGFGISAEGDHIGMSYEDSKKYYTEEQLEDDMGGHFGSGEDWTYILNDFELMQFTGLKDKNGIDIYSGDLYKCYGNLYTVTFYNGSFCGCLYGKNAPIPLNWENERPDNFVSKIKIIGSIYSNPELVNPS